MIDILSLIFSMVALLITLCSLILLIISHPNFGELLLIVTVVTTIIAFVLFIGAVITLIFML